MTSDRWSRRFDRPIDLPDGRTIATLAEARDYLLSLPASAHKTDAFAAALEAVVMAGEGAGPVMHANVGIGRLVNGGSHQPKPRRRRARRYRIIAAR